MERERIPTPEEVTNTSTPETTPSNKEQVLAVELRQESERVVSEMQQLTRDIDELIAMPLEEPSLAERAGRVFDRLLPKIKMVGYPLIGIIAGFEHYRQNGGSIQESVLIGGILAAWLPLFDKSLNGLLHWATTHLNTEESMAPETRTELTTLQQQLDKAKKV